MEKRSRSEAAEVAEVHSNSKSEMRRLAIQEPEGADAELEAIVSGGTTFGFARVVQKIHSIDFEGEYDALIKHLDPDPGRTEFGMAYAYADGAESRARKALQLMSVARVEQHSFEFRKSQVESGMRKEALARLQNEKDSGMRSKQITDSDVRAKMVEMYGDTIADMEEHSQKIANTVDMLTELATKTAPSRCKTANTMLATVRK